MNQKYPKRLIEVDLPIRRISAHARREKSIRHGHISTLHIWWARRPLAACRAVICASLWPDPADPLCPQTFRDHATKIIFDFASAAVRSKELGESCDHETWIKWQAMAQKGALDSHKEAHWNVLRFALLDFIADFANWDNSTVTEYLETSRALTQAAHEALGGELGTRPLVADPFAGGGSIPVEALRVGADAFASDLNPIPVLLNKVTLEYIPKYGQRLGDEVRKWGEWIKREAEKELAKFYPKGADEATPVTYLWARTIKCEGPGCGAEVPLIKSLWLARKDNRSVALQMAPDCVAKHINFRIIAKHTEGWIDESEKTKVPAPNFDGTVKRGSVTCPLCGYTTPLSSVKIQLQRKRGGTDTAQLACVIKDKDGKLEFYPPTDEDLSAVHAAILELNRRSSSNQAFLSYVPEEATSNYHVFVNRGPLYGMSRWRDYFTSRQALSLATIGNLVRQAGEKLKAREDEFSTAVMTCLAFALDKCIDYTNSCTNWMPRGTVGHLFCNPPRFLPSCGVAFLRLSSLGVEGCVRRRWRSV